MPLGPAPSGGSGGSKSGGAATSSGSVGTAPASGGGSSSSHKGLLGGQEGGLAGIKRFFSHPKEAQQRQMAGLSILGRPAEALQGAVGLKNLETGERDSPLAAVQHALGGGTTYGVQGHGVLNTVANLGIDLVDPTILVSGGAKEAQMGSRLLAEAGAEELAKKAATKAGLSEAEKVAAKEIIAKQIARGGAGALAKRTLAERLTGRLAGLSGDEIAAHRATEGLIKEGRGGLRIGGKTVLSGERISAGNDLARKLPGVAVAEDATKRLLIPRAGVSAALGKPTADILYEAQSKAAGELERHIGESVRPLQTETKLAKITEADRKGPLLAALEGHAGPIEPRLQPALDALTAQRAATTQQIVDRKLLPAEYVHDTASYVPRVTTDAGFKAIAKAERGGQLPAELAKVFKVSGSLEARKILPTATIPEAEAVVQGMLAKAGVKMKAGETFFEHDPVKAIVSHGAAVERASGQLGVLEHLASLPSGDSLVRLADTPTVPATNYKAELSKVRGKIQTAKKNLANVEGRLALEGPTRERPGGLIAPGLTPRTVDPVAGLTLAQRKVDLNEHLLGLQDQADALAYARDEAGHAHAAADAARKPPEGFEAIKVGEQTAYVHPELAKEINGAKRLVDSGEAVQRFTRHIDDVQNFWRAQVTVLPLGTGFFARNFQGNILLNAIDNVGLRDYAKALRLQRGVREANKTGRTLEDILGAEDARLVREAESHNVYNHGAQEADLNHVSPASQVGPAKGVTAPLRGHLNVADFPVLGTERGPVQAGRSLNAVIENNARLANFVANVRHSGHFAEAARRTRLTLFDYGDLTAAERHIGRRVVPFYTFARKSTGLLLRELIHDPAKLNRISKVLGAGEDATGLNVDSPYDAAARTLETPLIPGAAKATLGGGGYLGALKQQVLGTTIQDKNTGGFTTIDPNAPQSENRLERGLNALLPEYGKFGRVQRTAQRAAPGPDQDLLRLFLGLSPEDAPAGAGRTPGGGIVPQSTPKKKATGTTKAKAGGVGPSPR